MDGGPREDQAVIPESLVDDVLELAVEPLRHEPRIRFPAFKTVFLHIGIFVDDENEIPAARAQGTENGKEIDEDGAREIEQFPQEVDEKGDVRRLACLLAFEINKGTPTVA